MARRFTGGNSDVSTHGTGASLANLTAWTWLFWLKTGTLTTFKTLVDKSGAAGNSGLKIHSPGAGAGLIRVSLNRATTGLSYITNNQAMSNATVYCVAVVFDTNGAAGDLVRVYIGTPATQLTASTFGTATDGSGAYADDSANNLLIGNDSSAVSSYPCDLGCAVLWSRALSLAELRTQQFAVEPNFGVGLNCLFDGPGTQLDSSPYGNHGTLTGTTTAALVEADPFLYPPEPAWVWAKLAAVPPVSISPAFAAAAITGYGLSLGFTINMPDEL